jgi:hypothetical protein
MAKESSRASCSRISSTYPTVTLEDVVGSGCDLLKLDCEAAEFEALLSAGDDKLRRAQRIILECHRIAGSPAIVHRLETAGMKINRLAETGSD